MEAYSGIEKHASDIVKRLAMSKEEESDMRTEFLTHMLASKEDYEKEGYTEKEAEKLAISQFGKPENIAEDMHESLFPHRKLLFLILAVLSLVTAFGTYYVSLFSLRDAYYIPFVLTVLTSTTFLVLSEAKYPRWEKKRYLIALLIIHIILFVMQAMMAANIIYPKYIQVPLSILAYTIILFTIVLIYRVALAGSQQNRLKVMHVFYITIGILFSFYGLFMLWASLAFGGGLGMVTVMAGTPMTGWIIAYILQVQLMKRGKKKAALVVFALFMLLSLVAVTMFMKGMMLT